MYHFAVDTLNKIFGEIFLSANLRFKHITQNRGPKIVSSCIFVV
jgi:hypothetical protein